MKAFFVTMMAVATAEIGDKTQFLAIILASRYKKPFTIILGIVIATFLNHLLAGIIGEWAGSQLKSSILHIILSCSYLLAAIWILIPDKPDTEDSDLRNHSSILITTIITFFIAEMGDKTQIITAMLAANYQSLVQVVLGSTLGMLIANIPAIFLGNKVSQYIPMKIMRIIAASIFIVLAVIELPIKW